MKRDFAYSIAGALMEHFLERTTLVHLHQCIVLILRKRSKLNEETLFMSWWRSAIKEVDNWGPQKVFGKITWLYHQKYSKNMYWVREKRIKPRLCRISWLCTIMLAFCLVKLFTMPYKTSRRPNSWSIPPKKIGCVIQKR